jgi:hypothetical protein
MDTATVVKLEPPVKTPRRRRRTRPVAERTHRKASQLAISKASQAAATALATLDAMPATPVPTPETAVARNVVAGPWVKPQVEVKAPRRSAWAALGRIGIGAAIISTGAFIAFTSMRANSWFGHALTPDPAAGDIYAALSVAAEILACLIPTGIRFYSAIGERWTAFRGWALMAVTLTVVFLASGGFAVSNLSAGVEARAERSTAETILAQRRLDTVSKAREAECKKRGERCRALEGEERAAIASLSAAQATVKAEADPQAAALGISSARLHTVQAGSMVALCLFSGLFISFGMGLVFRN